MAEVDFRKGIDGLQAVCRNLIEKDPFSGMIFIFKNRAGSSIRTLAYDGQGFCMRTKRLSRGKFYWWPKNGFEIGITIRDCDLQALLWNGNPEGANFSEYVRVKMINEIGKTLKFEQKAKKKNSSKSPDGKKD